MDKIGPAPQDVEMLKGMTFKLSDGSGLALKLCFQGMGNATYFAALGTFLGNGSFNHIDLVSQIACNIVCNVTICLLNADSVVHAFGQHFSGLCVESWGCINVWS